MTPRDNSVRQLRGDVLRSVSRSFYLSIRILPAQLRDPIALAYLLARATDTIADTVEIDANTRMEQLRKLARMIQGEESAPGSGGSFASFVALQANAKERALIESLAVCFTWLACLPAFDQADIRAVLAHINEGQTLDVQRFANPAELTALRTAAELDRYTYLVAGCVGEFWTRVCSHHLAKFTDLPHEQMLSLGREYGKGLQLINILRDLGADLRAGRCYLPADELNALGLAPEQLLTSGNCADAIVRDWQERAARGLAAGLEYSCAIKRWRVRFATALPALIGARTLALLRAAGTRAFSETIKVSRTEVRRIVFRTARTLASPGTLAAEFKRLSSL
ncbi:MAG: squalene/phytoene synthase family protein [Verrucomicrobiota bacterium]|nr:squalene/phytoene synthase family protein [Verrucomicrobiota bacterium]